MLKTALLWIIAAWVFPLYSQDAQIVDVNVEFHGLMLFNHHKDTMNVYLPTTPTPKSYQGSDCQCMANPGQTHKFVLTIVDGTVVGSPLTKTMDLDGYSVSFDNVSSTEFEVNLDRVLPISRYDRRSAVKLRPGLDDVIGEEDEPVLNARLSFQKGVFTPGFSRTKTKFDHRWPRRYRLYLRPKKKPAADHVEMACRVERKLVIQLSHLDGTPHPPVEIEPTKANAVTLKFEYDPCEHENVPVFHWLYFSKLTEKQLNVDIPEYFVKKKGIVATGISGALCPPGKLP